MRLEPAAYRQWNWVWWYLLLIPAVETEAGGLLQFHFLGQPGLGRELRGQHELHIEILSPCPTPEKLWLLLSREP